MSNDNENAKTNNALVRALAAAQLASKNAGVPPPPNPAARGLAAARPKNALTDLAAMLRPPVKGLYYNGKVINVDGYEFIECRFDNCKLIVKNGSFEFTNCVFDATTSVEFGGDTLKVFRLYNVRPSAAPPRQFMPRFNQNGSVTVTGDLYE
jgi:hypothetical protein